MAQAPGAVVAVVEAELTTPQRPTAVCKGAEIIAEVAKAERQAEVAKAERQAEVAKAEQQAEVAKAERQAEVAKAERQAEVAKVVLQVQVVAVAAKIQSCLKCLILHSVMAMENLIGGGLSLMAILEHSGRHQLLVRVALALKI